MLSRSDRNSGWVAGVKARGSTLVEPCSWLFKHGAFRLRPFRGTATKRDNTVLKRLASKYAQTVIRQLDRPLPIANLSMEAYYNTFIYPEEVTRIPYQEWLTFLQSNYPQSARCPFTPEVDTARKIPTDPSLPPATIFYAHARGADINVPVPLHPKLVGSSSRSVSIRLTPLLVLGRKWFL